MKIEKNRIYNMDCIEGMKSIEDKSIDLILTDIPYGQLNNRVSNIREVNKGNADKETFDLESFLKECVRVCNGSIYIFCSTEQVSYIRSYLDNHKFTTRLGIWEKTNPSPVNGQYMWLSGIETCVFGIKPKSRGGSPTFNEHCKNSVWRFPNGRSKIHPTEKPLPLFEYLIKTSSNEGMTVLDPCIGSGTTAEACLKLGRDFIGFELDPDFSENANKRIEKYREE